MKKPVCSIIIRAYNEEKHIQRLLSGIMEQSVKEIQIILVDSGSQDRTRAFASEFPVEIMEIPPLEFTFGRSLNLGISKATSDLIVMASAHVYPVYPDWLETLLEPFENQKIALTYGKQRGAETTHFSEHQIFQHWFPDASTHNQNHPFCNNANAAIRKSLWELHPYDETLPGLEDLEWGNWAQEQGFRIDYVAEAEVIHVHNESLSSIRNRYKREGMAFKRIYPNETFHRRDLLRLVTQNIVSDLRAAARQKVILQNWLKIIRFRWQQFYGTFQGYRQSGPLTWALKQAFYYPRSSKTSESATVKRDVEPIQYQ